LWDTKKVKTYSNNPCNEDNIKENISPELWHTMDKVLLQTTHACELKETTFRSFLKHGKYKMYSNCNALNYRAWTLNEWRTGTGPITALSAVT